MQEFMIPLNSKSELPLYEQICEYIKTEIQQGHLKAEEKLPSSRTLAKSLSVSRSTVELSYDQLVSEGYLEAIPCKGYYVCNIQGLYTFSKKPGDEKRISKKEEDKARSDYDFALNGIDAQGFPYNI